MICYHSELASGQVFRGIPIARLPADGPWCLIHHGMGSARRVVVPDDLAERAANLTALLAADVPRDSYLRQPRLWSADLDGGQPPIARDAPAGDARALVLVSRGNAQVKVSRLRRAQIAFAVGNATLLVLEPGGSASIRWGRDHRVELAHSRRSGPKLCR